MTLNDLNKVSASIAGTGPQRRRWDGCPLRGPVQARRVGRGRGGDPAKARVHVLVERFDIEPFSDFSAK